ncbi:MAG: outer membrane beta-barrel protein [Beijerinckiaceae bacterium]|nr:outer membrane beta-barrel protein [Beijerinckiaceae bacterium]
MRGLLLSSVALAVMTAASVAADLPARAPAMAPAPMYAAPIFTWSGFYVGLNAGAGFRSSNSGRSDYVFDSPAGSVDPGLIAGINADLALAGRRGGRNTGFTGGAQLGFNWQFGALVAGVEADINYLDRGRVDRGYTILNLAGTDLDLTVGGIGRGSDYFGTLRARIGYAFDRTMVYATGGLAYSDSGNRRGAAFVTDPFAGDALVATYTSRGSSSNWGYAIGAGVEHAFTDNWTAKVEYLYVDLDRGGSHRYTSVGAGAPFDNIVGVRRGDDSGMHIVRVGMNYKFGGGRSSGPVVAAY